MPYAKTGEKSHRGRFHMRNCSAMKSLYSTQNRPLYYNNLISKKEKDL